MCAYVIYAYMHRCMLARVRKGIQETDYRTSGTSEGLQGELLLRKVLVKWEVEDGSVVGDLNNLRQGAPKVAVATNWGSSLWVSL